MAAAFRAADSVAKENESNRDVVSLEWAVCLKAALEEEVWVSDDIYPPIFFNVRIQLQIESETETPSPTLSRCSSASSTGSTSSVERRKAGLVWIRSQPIPIPSRRPAD